MKKQTKKDKAFIEKCGTLWIKPGLCSQAQKYEKAKAKAQQTANSTGCPVLLVKGSAQVFHQQRKQQEDSFPA